MKPASFILALLLAACSPDGPRLGRKPHLIIGGTPTTGDPSVVGLLADWLPGAPIVCTGTMVSDEHVLTAAHCVVDSTNRPVYMPVLFVCPDRWTDGTNPDCFVAPVYSDPEVWGFPWVHPDFDINSDDLAHDIAVFRVEPFGVAFKPLPSDSSRRCSPALAGLLLLLMLAGRRSQGKPVDRGRTMNGNTCGPGASVCIFSSIHQKGMQYGQDNPSRSETGSQRCAVRRRQHGEEPSRASAVRYRR